MIGAVKKIGNSAGIVIPKPMLAQFGAKAGDAVDIHIEGDRLVVEPVRRKPRAGWAEDAMQVASETDDSAWLDVRNDEDADLEW